MRQVCSWIVLILAAVTPSELRGQAVARGTRDTVTVGLFQLPPTSNHAEMAQKFQELHGQGITYAYMFGYTEPIADDVMSLAAIHDFAIVPHLNTYNAVLNARWNPLDPNRKPIAKPYDSYPGQYNIGENDWAQRYEDGAIAFSQWSSGYPLGDPLAPKNREAARRSVSEVGKALARQPHSGRWVSYDDEYWHQYDYTGKGMPIYSPWSRQTIQSLSGYGGEQLEWHRPPGYVADGKDPFVAVRHTVGYRQGFYNNALSFHHADLSHVLHRQAPGVHDFTTPGAFGGETAVQMVEMYDATWNSSVLHDAFDVDHVWSTAGPKARPHALIGWYSTQPADLEYLARRINVSARLAMLRGCESFAFAPGGPMLAVPQWREQILKSAAEAKRFGTLLRRLERTPSRVGLLWSETTVSHQTAMDWPKVRELAAQKKYFESPWEHLHAVGETAYGALCRAGYPPRIITERDVVEGVLDDLDVLVMVNHQYSETRLMRRYEAFAQRGGLLLADKTTRALPEGATVLDINGNAWNDAIVEGKRYGDGPDKARYLATYELNQSITRAMGRALHAAIGDRVRNATFNKGAEGAIVPWEARAAGARYLLAINSDVKDASEEDLVIAHAGPIYDLISGQRITSEADELGRQRVTLKLGPGEWAIWMLAQRPVGKAGALIAVASEPAAVRCMVWDDEGFPMPGVVPFSVKTRAGTVYGIAEHGAGAVWLNGRLLPDDPTQVECLGLSVNAPWLKETGE